MIELHARCYYPIYDGFKSSDYPPQKFIKSIKGQAFNGYADLPLLNGKTLRLNSTNAQNGVRIFGQWAAARIAGLGINPISLVPIPSSKTTDPSEPFTAKAMCEAINEFAAVDYEILPVLAQASAVKASSKGGSRKYVDIKGNLCCHGGVNGKTVILVDDVVTSGNHLKACAALLREHGATANHAISAGRTIWERPSDMWAVPVENVDWDSGDF